MNHIILTPRGQEILTTAANNVSGEGIKWIGYYGLAYVPFPSGADSQFSDSLIREDEHGDYIYNIWQGDLLGSGFVGGKVNTLTLYDANLASNYRYVYDEEKGCNRLVTWTTDGDPLGEDSDPSKTPKQFIRTGYRIYEGVKIADEGDEAVESDTGMPVPAPLFYMGDDSTYSRPLDASGVTGKVGDGPVVKSGDAQGAPLVTPDMRFYDGPLFIDDSTFTSLVSSSGTISPFDVVPSVKTRGEESDAESLDQFAKFKSVSNYNKGHGHVSSEGYGMDAQESCHNMSLVTKLFPISTYEVTSDGPATTGETLTDTGSRNRAKVIKYGIKLNLNDAVTGMQLLNDRYEYKAPDDIEPEDESARELYTNPPMNSLKFNRIGIYAVDATIRHFNKSEAGSAGCLANSYQVEISPDAKPELIAVMLIDECCISEDSSFGMNSFSTNFILNLENVTESTSVCTNPDVYYNLSENEAITWYQNQLLASAGLSEAVTSLGVDIAHLKNQYGTGSNDCYAKSDGTEYASKDHTHDYLKNLVDDEGQDGSVRGIMSNPHSVPYAPLGKTEAWGCGKLSFTMGDDNATAGNFSFNLTAKGAIDDNSSHVLLMGGDAEDNADYLVVKNTNRSIIMGKSGIIDDVSNSIVLLGDSSGDFVNDWLGGDRRVALRNTYDAIHDAGFDTIEPNAIMQLTHTSVTYSGALALGGHLIGNGEPITGDYYQPREYGLLNLGNPEPSVMAYTERDLHINSVHPRISVAGSNVTLRGVDVEADAVDPIKMIGANLDNDAHYVVHSPHAGKPLVVAETQELDGTLHIGLGQDVRHGNDNFVSVECAYIASAAAVVVKVMYRDIKAPGSTVSEAFKLTIEGEDEVITEQTTTEITATRGIIQDGNFVMDATVPSYSGISIHGNVERYPDPVRKSKIIDLTIALPADRAAFYHISGGSTVGSFINSTYYDITPGAFCLQLTNCTNITNTNTFIRYTGTPIVDLPYVYVMGPFIHEYQSNLYNALGRATIEISKLYRISAVNYHDAGGNIPMVVASNEYGMRIEEIPIDYSGSGNAVIDVPDPRSLKGCYYVVEQPADNEWGGVSDMEWYYSPISGMNRTAELVLNPTLHGKYDVTVPDYIDTPYGAVQHWEVDHFEVNWSSLLRGGDDFYIRVDKAFKINDPAIGQISCDANTWYRVEVITEVRNLDTYPSTMNYYRVTSI